VTVECRVGRRSMSNDEDEKRDAGQWQWKNIVVDISERAVDF
jgi:hypothetical protein